MAIPNNETLGSASYQSWSGNLLRQPTSEKYPDSAIRFDPHTIDMPETFGVQLVQSTPGLRVLSLLQRNFGNRVSVENQPNLQDVELPYFINSLDNVRIKNNQSLSSINAPNIALPLWGSSLASIPGNSSLGPVASIDFSGNALNSTYIDQLFNALALSLSTGRAYYTTIDTSGGTNAAPTAASSAALSSLATGAYHITVVHN